MRYREIDTYTYLSIGEFQWVIFRFYMGKLLSDITFVDWILVSSRDVHQKTLRQKPEKHVQTSSQKKNRHELKLIHTELNLMKNCFIFKRYVRGSSNGGYPQIVGV